MCPVRCHFSTFKQCQEWLKRLNRAIAHPSRLEDLFALAYHAWSLGGCADDEDQHLHLCRPGTYTHTHTHRDSLFNCFIQSKVVILHFRILLKCFSFFILSTVIFGVFLLFCSFTCSFFLFFFPYFITLFPSFVRPCFFFFFSYYDIFSFLVFLFFFFFPSIFPFCFSCLR